MAEGTRSVVSQRFLIVISRGACGGTSVYTTSGVTFTVGVASDSAFVTGRA